MRHLKHNCLPPWLWPWLWLAAVLACCEVATTLTEDFQEPKSSRGNPVCWSQGFTYELCCGEQTPAVKTGCWGIHFTYDLCCLDPQWNTDNCRNSVDTADILWHCRMRSHYPESKQCFGPTPATAQLSMGQLWHAHKTYAAYVEAQRAKSARELHGPFIGLTMQESDAASLYLARHFQTRLNREQRTLRGLCHGAKNGEEVRSLRAALQSHGSFVAGVSVLGTDITEEAVRASSGDVILKDYHAMEPSWAEQWDFIYSNTLDHSFQPMEALRVWRQCLRTENGLLVLRHDTYHNVNNIDLVDVYGGSLNDFCNMLRILRYEILDVVRLPGGVKMVVDLIFARRGSLPFHTDSIVKRDDSGAPILPGTGLIQIMR